jgi:hypothetical protein
MARIADWAHRTHPTVVVVDVSIEVAVYLRLMGVPVIVIAVPGTRDDAAHQLGYAVADRIIAAWPAEVYKPAWLAAHRAKTRFVGAWSRFSQRPRTQRHIAGKEQPTVLVLAGAGGSSITTQDVHHWRQHNTTYTWNAVGVPGTSWLADPWDALCSADVVITHAGQNAIADVAAAGRHRCGIAPPRRANRRRPCPRRSKHRHHPARLARPTGLARRTRPCSQTRRGRLEQVAPQGCTRGGGSRHQRRGSNGAGMQTAVVTIAAGRHDHLRRQRRGLAEGERLARHVIVAMGDRGIDDAIKDSSASSFVTHMDVPPGAPLPLAAARNAGARLAIATGADLLIFLDVDCIPSPTLVRRYEQAACQLANHRALLCGTVAYLPPPGPRGHPHGLDLLATAHPARPDPAPGDVLMGKDYNLFWSLSFAVTTQTWRILGGFCEDYNGYGGEDTDFAWQARARGIGLRWIGGATAYHQHHPISDPPTEHLDDILRNAAIFHRRWGSWPMRGWLTQFERAGVITFDTQCSQWRRIRSRK